jgi:outer membrane protein assembly factor BamB
LNDDGLDCRDGRTGESRWSLNLADPPDAVLTDGIKLIWPWNLPRKHGLDNFDARPWVVSFSDMNADGALDLVLAARHQTWLLAVSGLDGQPLWIVARPGAIDANEKRYPNVIGAITYPPLIVGDQDGDGIADLVVTFTSVTQNKESMQWIELLSGASGQALWRYDLPESRFALPDGEEVPVALRWFFGPGGYTYQDSQKRDHGVRHTVSRELGFVNQSGSHLYLATRPHEMDGTGEASYLALVAGMQFITIDVKSGQSYLPPQDIGVRTVLQPPYADLDGDGQADLLLTEQLAPIFGARDHNPPPGSTGNVPQLRLTAWSPARESILWQSTVEARLPHQPAMHIPSPGWPIVADLDDDGANEVLVPSESSLPEDRYDSPPWGKLQVLDGTTGKPRWTHHLMNMDQQLDCFIVGPDINGDGLREVYVASFWGAASELFVDCLSGRDGSSLWRGQENLKRRANEYGNYQLAELSWHEAGNDGWPQLVVRARAENSEADRVVLFSSGTGRMSHFGPDITDVEVADVDGDGVEDLVTMRRKSPQRWDHGGTLHVYRGVGREIWRQVCEQRSVSTDLDGDGVLDLVDSTRWMSGFNARSGVSNELLWNLPQGHGGYGGSLHTAAEKDSRNELFPRTHDLNGDGAPDLLRCAGSGISDRPLVQAISGRDGRVLWESDVQCNWVQGVALVECRDLDGDGHAEVVVAAKMRIDETKDESVWLVVLSGRDGQRRWSKRLLGKARTDGGTYFHFQQVWLEVGYVDLNGDGILDFVFPAERPRQTGKLELRALSGTDGAQLWQRDIPSVKDQSRMQYVPPVAIGDLDNDGKPDVVVFEIDQPAAVARVRLLDGETGQSRWQWEAPCNYDFAKVNQESRLKTRPRPVLMRRANGKQWVAVCTGEHDMQRIHILDETGKLVSESILTRAMDRSYPSFRPWACDVDGDGEDELLTYQDNSLMLVPPDQLDQPIWKHAPSPQLTHVLGLLPDQPGGIQIVVQGVDGDQSLRGIDAATGRTLWTCVSPMSPADSTLLAAPRGDQPPLARYHRNSVSFGRQGVVLEWRGKSDEPRVRLASLKYGAALLII